MMIAAQQRQIRQICRTAQVPRNYVMGLTPGGRPGAAGERATVIAGGQSQPLRAGGGSQLTPESEHAAVVVQHDGHDRRLGGQRQQALGGHHVAVPGLHASGLRGELTPTS